MADPETAASQYSSRFSDFPTGSYERASIFRNALLEACTNPTKLEGRMYRGLRAEFMRNASVAELLPEFIQKNEDVEGFLQAIQGLASRSELRRKHIWDAFDPVLDQLKPGRREVTRPLTDREKLGLSGLADEEPKAGDVVLSSGWTGTRTIQEQCSLVRQLVPAALDGLRVLINEQERRLHNQPPEALSDGGIEALRDLHSALAELLRLAEQEAPLDAAMSRVRWGVRRAFVVMRDTGELLAGGVPALAASTITGWGTFALCRLVIGLEGEASATLGAAAVGATVMEAGKQRRKR